MERVIYIFGKVFDQMIVQSNGLGTVVYFITRQPYLLIGAAFLIIGFAISLIRRIIHS